MYLHLFFGYFHSYSYNIYLLGANYVPGNFLGPEVNKYRHDSCLHLTSSQVGERDIN